MMITVEGLVPQDEDGNPVVIDRPAKPRGSLQDAIRAKQDCVPCQAEQALKRSAAVAVRGYLTPWKGLGVVTTEAGKALEAAGLPVAFVGLPDKTGGGAGNWVQARTVGRPLPGRPVLQVSGGDVPALPGHPTCFLTMWESSRVSPRWVANLNTMHAVVVPCRWNAEGFRASGVTVPAHVVPLGVDGNTFRPAPWREGGPFTVGMAARMAHGGIRKGLNEGVEAFLKAFPPGADVRLSVKVNPDCLAALRIPDDPRIEVVTDTLAAEGLVGWYAGLDALFVPAKAEGWGLHTIQAMACGRPVIAAKFGGTAEFFDGSCGWELPFTEEPAGEFYAGLGEWAVPTEEGMVEALRSAYRGPDACRRKGALAAERAREFGWDRTGRELVKVLKETGLVPGKAVAPG